MTRQRLRLNRIGIAEFALRLTVSAFAVALLFYGVMFLLGGLKLSPESINSISAYQTVRRALESITASSITGADRITVAIAGLLAAAVFGTLFWKALPRPYLARHELSIAADSEPGATLIGPRAVERAAEGLDDVSSARARCDRARVEVSVGLARPGADLLASLRSVQQLVRSSLTEHGFPPLAVDVTLTTAPRPLPAKEIDP